MGEGLAGYLDERLIDRAEALRYLGVRGEAPAELEEQLAAACAALCRTARPRTVWRLFPLSGDGTLADIRLPGSDIRALLRGCGEAVLFGATLGMEAERLLRRAQARDMAEALLLDAAANTAIEGVCDALCAALARTLAPRFLTGRFSPGYGDLPLSVQADICRALDLPRRIGVSLTPGGLLLPQKTVTALMGVSETPQPARRRNCAACARAETCPYRREGAHCGNV